MDRSQQPQAGFTLLEILIGLGILLFILFFVLKMNLVTSQLAYDNQIELERVCLARSAMEIVTAGLEAQIEDEIENNTLNTFLTKFELNEDVDILDVQYEITNDDENGIGFQDLVSSPFQLINKVTRVSRDNEDVAEYVEEDVEYEAIFVISVKAVPAGADPARYEPLKHCIIVE
jgi:type II secretory pathway pseudopilin PulG